MIRLNVADDGLDGGPAPELVAELVLAVSAQLLVVERLGYVDVCLPDLRPAPVAPVDGDLAGGPSEDRLVLLDDRWQRVAVVGVAEAERPDDSPARAAPVFSVTVSETLLRFAAPAELVLLVVFALADALHIGLVQ